MEKHECPPEWFIFLLIQVFVIAPFAGFVSTPLAGFMGWMHGGTWHPWPQVLSATILSMVWNLIGWRRRPFELAMARMMARGAIAGLSVFAGTLIACRIESTSGYHSSTWGFYVGPFVTAGIGIAFVLLAWNQRRINAESSPHP